MTAKNTHGELGPICNNCGGYGFTNSITGASAGCPYCLGSGIQPPDLQKMAAQIEALTKAVEKLLEAKSNE